MRALVGYALSGAVLVGAGAAAVVWLLVPEAAAAVWWAAGVAYGVQLVAFAGLVAFRRRGARVFVAWGGGTVLRFAAVAWVGLWLGGPGGYPPAPLLLSLVGFLFPLLLLEPVFLRMGMRSR